MFVYSAIGERLDLTARVSSGLLLLVSISRHDIESQVSSIIWSCKETVLATMSCIYM